MVARPLPEVRRCERRHPCQRSGQDRDERHDHGEQPLHRRSRGKAGRPADDDRDDHGDRQPGEERKAARHHMFEERQLPEEQPRKRDGECLLADVQPRPEREHKEQRPGDARDADPDVVPLANRHDDEQDQERQAEVTRRLVIEAAEFVGHPRRRVGGDQLVGRRKDEVQEVGRVSRRVLDLPADPLRSEELGGERPAREQQERQRGDGERGDEPGRSFAPPRPDARRDARRP